MPKLFRIFILLAIAALPCFALAPFNISCQRGAQTVTTSSIPSTTKVQQSYAGATVTVFIHGGAAGVVSTSGTAVTWVSGTQFNANSDWNGGPITINAVSYSISTVTDTTHLTLGSSAGTQTSVAYSIATAKAPIFSDYLGATPQANPLTCSATAGFLVFSPNSIIDETFSGTGITAPFTLAAAPGVDPLSTTTGLITYNASIGTAASQCTAAASANQTLIVPQVMGALTTQALTCSMTFLNGGMLQPSSGQTVTISPNFSCGTYQRCFDVSLGGTVAFASPPAVINPNWYGADWTGTNDSATALTAALNASQSAVTNLYLPSGSYKHSGLSFNGHVSIIGAANNGIAPTSYLIYSGTGTGITCGTSITQCTGSISNIGIRSNQGHNSVAICLQLENATELAVENIYIGGAPTSGCAIGAKLITSGANWSNITSSWNDVAVLAYLGSSANAGNVFTNGTCFQAKTACFQLQDVGQLTVTGFKGEAFQNFILVDNTADPAVIGGPVVFAQNQLLLVGSENGVTFTNPLVVKVNANNAANSITFGSHFYLTENIVTFSASATYLNSFTRTSSSNPFATSPFVFRGNNWTGAASISAVNHADSAATIINGSYETRPPAIPYCSGTPLCFDTEITGTQAGPSASVYNGIAALPLSVVWPSAGAASAVVNYQVELQSLVIKCNSTASVDAGVLLPGVSSQPGQVVIVKKIDAAAHNCIVSPGVQNIDGSTASFNVNQDFGYWTGWFDGAAWWTIGAGAGVH